MSLRKRLINEIEEFLNSLDLDQLYTDIDNKTAPFPLFQDLFHCTLILAEYYSLTECGDYGCMAQVLGKMLECENEDTCCVSHRRLKSCLAYVEFVIKNKPSDNKKSYVNMYL